MADKRKMFGSSVAAAFLAMLSLLLVLVVLGPIFGVLQGMLLPVTSRVVLVDVEYNDREARTYFRMSYYKYVNCSILGRTIKRLGVDVVAGPADNTEKLPTVHTGVHTSNLWFVAGPPPLDDLEIFWLHSCHPFWVVVTNATPLPDAVGQSYGVAP